DTTSHRDQSTPAALSPLHRLVRIAAPAERHSALPADALLVGAGIEDQFHSRTSTKCPAIAAAAAIAGGTKWVRPFEPGRRPKLRFEVGAQPSPGASVSGFIARHIEQPGSRHSNPALTKILSRPSDSACALTRPEPGTIMALTVALTFLPPTTLATSRRSSMRALVQEPIKPRSMAMSVIFSPPFSPIYLSARSTASRFLVSATSSTRGTRPVTEVTCSGLVPQVTSGGSLAASSLTSRSNREPSSERIVSQ